MKLTINVDELLPDLRRVAEEEIPQLVADVTLKTGLELHRGLVLKSPRDTGRFQNSWNLTADSPDESVAPEVPKGTTLPVPRDVPSLDVKPFGSVYENNSLPYGPRLNDGWSDQAPAFFVEQTISEVTNIPLDRLIGGDG